MGPFITHLSYTASKSPDKQWMNVHQTPSSQSVCQQQPLFTFWKWVCWVMGWVCTRLAAPCHTASLRPSASAAGDGVTPLRLHEENWLRWTAGPAWGDRAPTSRDCHRGISRSPPQILISRNSQVSKKSPTLAPHFLLSLVSFRLYFVSGEPNPIENRR